MNPKITLFLSQTSEEEKSRKRKWELVDGNSNTLSAEISDTASKSICHGSEFVDQTLSTGKENFYNILKHFSFLKYSLDAFFITAKTVLFFVLTDLSRAFR